MKILLVLPPTPDRAPYPEPPAGLLYYASALERAGHKPIILDLQLHYLVPLQVLEIIENGNYEAIGFGGISTCYSYVKKVSNLIRQKLPSIPLIAGGVLCSVYDLLLKNTPIDVICMGEGETTGVEIVNCLGEGRCKFDDIKGIAFIKNNQIIKTPPREYIKNIDDIPIPHYYLIDMEKYILDPMNDEFFAGEEECRKFYKKGMRNFNIKTARGCTNACAFCYRHFHGYRQHSVDYVLKHITYLQEKYNIHFFHFGDELFTRNRDWVIDFCKKLIREKIRIYYIIHGVRVDTVDSEMMYWLKESGCITVFIGFESGSQRVLDEMKKRVTIEENIKAVQTIINSGVKVFVQIVVGMPSETDETIRETTDALIKTGVEPEYIGINYAQAYPSTWLWQYAIQNGFIKDPDEYLEKVGKTTSFLINYTKVSDKKTKKWRWYILKGVLKVRAKRTSRFLDLVKTFGRQFYTLIYTYEKYGFKEVTKLILFYPFWWLKRKLA